METIVFEIEFNDGRIFRVFCANSTQKKRVIQSYHKIKSKAKDIRVITNGIHTTKQYEQILKTI
jgi:hypothetical protein